MEKISKKIDFAINELNDRLIERDQLVRLTILALFSKSHMFLIGERGVAKSLTIRIISNLVEKTKYWELQVGIDTETKQLFGEKKVAENGTVYYEAKNTILDAEIVFLDEMFKAKNEVLNMLLQIMVDRYYTTGDGRMIKVPLIMLCGASNEYPTGEFAEPYLDRLLFWYKVDRIKKHENREKFFNFNFNTNSIEKPIFTKDEIDYVYAQATKKIKTPKIILDLFNEIVDNLILQGVKTSDRKFLNIMKTMKVCVLLNERDSLDYSDMFLFLFTAWHNDVEQRKVEDVVYYQIFSNQANIEGKLENIKKVLEVNQNFISGRLYDFINYRLEFVGDEASQLFYQYITAAIKSSEKFDNIKEEIEELKRIIEHIYAVEEMIENNIFITNIKNKTLNQFILDSIDKQETLLKHESQNLQEWINRNKDILSYKRNQQNEQ